MDKRLQISLTLILFVSTFINAQNIVKGTVNEEGDLPVPDVEVYVKGSVNYTLTDENGKYEIEAKPGEVLVFSSLHHDEQEVIVVKDIKEVNVMLQFENVFDQVVVVGYGTQKKKEVTGAVSRVDSKDILKNPTSDLGASIQGQIAGVNVQSSSGRPGDPANIQIRGVGSVDPGALGPLYVVDGIPYQDNPQIAPEQIESIDILKDGAAASIYGVRASNGVILITTKKGDVGKMQVNFSTYTGIQNITSGTPLMNTLQQLYAEEVTLDALGQEPQVFFFNPNALDYNTSFVEDVQNDNARISNYNLDLSGGVSNLRLNFNLNYFDQEGVLINSDFDRLTTRLTGEFKKDKLYVFTTLSMSQEERNQEPFALYEYAIGQMPWQPSINDLQPVGQNGVNIPVRNPIFYSFLSQQLANIDERNVFTTNASFLGSYEILEGLKYELRLGGNTWDYRRKFFRPQYLVYGAEGDLNPTASRERAILNEDFIFTERQTIENIVNYNKTINQHDFTLTGVLSYEKFNSKSVSTGVIFDENATNDINNLSSGAEAIKPVGIDDEQTLAGKMLRLQYNYNDRYLFSASYRYDGSSQFSEDNRYKGFLGLSAGWNISEEGFFKKGKISETISDLKLRVSYAEVGNQSIASYSYIPVIESGINYPFGPNEGLEYGLIQRTIVDPNITWETKISKNIGLDLNMFKNRLQFTADLYQENREDMLLRERLPPSSGATHPRTNDVYDVKMINAGDMVNEGIELALKYNNKTKWGLKYNIAATFTKNNNEVTNLNGIERGYANGRPVVSQGNNVDYTTYLAEGYEAGAFFLVQTSGVIKTQEQLDAYRVIDASAQLGDMMYIDQNGDSVINDDDRVYAGSGQPEFEAGLSLSLEYKNFDFFINNYFSYGAEVYNGAKLYAYMEGRHRDQFSMWSPQNPDSNIPTNRENNFHSNVRAWSDYFLEDGTYWRIRTITLGYTIPDLDKIGIERARVYLTSVNPFTFTDYDGYDPEVGGDGLFLRGVDRGNYPVTRQFMLGLQLQF